MKTKLLGAAALALLVAACGTESRERVTGGAAAGAATGAGVGALGGPVGAVAGAVVGGGAGAVTGAVTEPRDLNLGSPPWTNPEVRTPNIPSGRSSASTGSTQQERSTRASTGSTQQERSTRASTGSMQQERSTRASRAAAQRESDRAYMGGGMIVDQPRGTTGGSSSNMGSSRGSGNMGSGGSMSSDSNPAPTGSNLRGGFEPRPGPDGRGTTRATGGTGRGGSGATLEQNPDRSPN